MKNEEASYEYIFSNREEEEYNLEEARDDELEVPEQQQEAESAARPVNQDRIEREESTPSR